MIYILDANTLLRYSDPKCPQHFEAVTAISELIRHGHFLRTVPQSLYEFWVVATRPLTQNGFGWPTADTAKEIDGLAVRFPLIEDIAGIFVEWRRLVETYDCKGKIAHDARYVAAMNTHGITHLLTFNTGDFARFPMITAVDPASVIPSVP